MDASANALSPKKRSYLLDIRIGNTLQCTTGNAFSKLNYLNIVKFSKTLPTVIQKSIYA